MYAIGEGQREVSDYQSSGVAIGVVNAETEVELAFFQCVSIPRVEKPSNAVERSRGKFLFAVLVLLGDAGDGKQ